MLTRSKDLVQQWVKRLEGQLQLEHLMEGCCKALLEITKADRISIMVLDGDTEELAVRWAQGVRVKPYGRLRFRLGEGLCGWVARSQKPLFSLDVSKELRYIPSPIPGPHFRKVKAIFCLPLVVEGRTVGVVNLSSFSSQRRFQWVSEHLAKRFLDRLARVIAQAVLLNEAEASSQRWRDIVKSTSATVAQVSHEVRTPLTLIAEATQQLLDGTVGTLTDKQRELVSLVKSQADRMTKLVTELLDLSRIEAGRLALQRSPIDLGALLKEVEKSYQPLVAPRRMRINLDSVPPVYGDRIRLTQVIENLLTNAVKFTPPDGSITLKLVARGRTAELTVTDTGIGIPKRQQRRLFERFFQPKIPTSFVTRGTGLGLAIVKEIVQLHGGTVRVSSEPGHGTTFTVGLPLYSPSFALTEEFRVMREQAAKEGLVLGVQLLQATPNNSLERSDVIEFLKKHLSREDRVLVNPKGGLVILCISDPAGFEAMRRRLEGILSSHPQRIDFKALRWGSVLVPQEETELAATMEKAQGRAKIPFAFQNTRGRNR